tara:strand:- start:243 stop:500 length:258 start_codon:yes stop_codon:yes gene_type:complete
MRNNLKTKPLEIEIINRWRWEVVVPVSSVRIGETSRELVKSKQRVDYLRLVTMYVGKNERDCKKWLDRHRHVLVKLGIPYEVGNS